MAYKRRIELLHETGGDGDRGGGGGDSHAPPADDGGGLLLDAIGRHSYRNVLDEKEEADELDKLRLFNCCGCGCTTTRTFECSEDTDDAVEDGEPLPAAVRLEKAMALRRSA